MLISTSDNTITSSLQDALFCCQPDKDSLWTFKNIPVLEPSIIDSFRHQNFIEISTTVLDTLINQDSIVIPRDDLVQIITKSYNFPITIQSVSPNLHFLELIHGNTCTFKDFGSRILAHLILYFKKDTSKLRVIVATSGDTGSAIADAFYQVDNIECHILFPKDKISPIQKQQITSYGENIFCYETLGNFDKCQKWVKKALDDVTLNCRVQITSANSINIGRLLGQISYYFYAYSRIKIADDEKFIVSIPSGNLGNLTGALIAQKMGVPLYKIVASCNYNGVLSEYLEMGIITREICQYTYSNAMDIIKPSNLKRVKNLFNNLYYSILDKIESTNISNNDTLRFILEVYEKYQYLTEPHTAVGYGGYIFMAQKYPDLKAQYLIVNTADPIKFQEVVHQVLPTTNIDIPPQLVPYLTKKMVYESIPHNYNYWKQRFYKNCKLPLSNITLIGMPGSGKSCLGKILAQKLHKNFIELDAVIEETYHLSLCEIIEEYGNEGFNKIEEKVYFSTDMLDSVLSPGGSIIYYPKVMQDILQKGLVIFLDVTEKSLLQRLGDFGKRGIVFPAGMDFHTLYQSRKVLFQKYADIVIESSTLSIDETIEKILLNL